MMKNMIQFLSVAALAGVFAILMPLKASAVEGKLPADAIGQVVYMTGVVRAEKPDGASRSLQMMNPVFKTDILLTGPASNVEVRFLDETILAQGADARISLDEYVYSDDPSASTLLFKMGTGTFRFITGEIVKQNPEAFQLNTPLTNIGIRGTEPFAIVQAAAEKIGVISIEPGHTVEVTSPRGTVSMDRPGVSTDVGADGSLSPPTPTPAAVQRQVIEAAPVTTQGELGAVGKIDPKAKVEAFRQTIAHAKGQLGGIKDSPDYGALHTINMQTQGQENAESERDGTAGGITGGGSDSGGSDGGSSEGGGGGPH